MRRYVPRFRFNPYSFDELWKPVEYATQVHRDVQDKLSANEMAAAEFLSYIDKDKDPVPYQIAQNYLASIDTAARDLNTKGLGSVGYARLMGLNSEYAHNVKPIENAVKNQQAYIAAQRQLKASNPSIAFVRDGSQMKLDEFKNGQPDLTYVDGNKVKQDAAMMAQALFSKKFTGMSKQKFDHYNDLVLMRYGMSLQDMIDNPNTKQSYDMMMNAVFDSNGVGNLNEQEQGRMKQLFDQGVTIGAAVTEQAQIVDNGNKFREQQAAAASRYRATQTKLKDLEDKISNMKKVNGIKPHGEGEISSEGSKEIVDKFDSYKRIYPSPMGSQIINDKDAIEKFLKSDEGKRFLEDIKNRNNYSSDAEYRNFNHAYNAIIDGGLQKENFNKLYKATAEFKKTGDKSKFMDSFVDFAKKSGSKRNTYIGVLGETYQLYDYNSQIAAFRDLINKFYQKRDNKIFSSGGFELELSPESQYDLANGVFVDINNDVPGGGKVVKIKNSGGQDYVTIDDKFLKDDKLKNASICLEPKYANQGLVAYVGDDKLLINLDQVGLRNLTLQMNSIYESYDKINKLTKNNDKSNDDTQKEIDKANENIRNLSEQVLKNLRQIYLHNRASSSFFENNDPSMVEFDYYSNPEIRGLEDYIMLWSKMQASGEY